MTNGAAYGGSMGHCVRTILKQDGIHGLYAGIVPRVAYIGKWMTAPLKRGNTTETFGLSCISCTVPLIFQPPASRFSSLPTSSRCKRSDIGRVLYSALTSGEGLNGIVLLHVDFHHVIGRLLLDSSLGSQREFSAEHTNCSPKFVHGAL